MKKTIIAVLVLILNISLVPIQIVHAANASLYITPSSSSQTVGNNFTVYVGVNSGGNAVNAIEATVNLPTSVVSITGAETGGSLCSIWVQQPAISGSSVSFKCGIPGGTTNSGNLISVSLKASSVGSGNASISGARVLAGPGDNVTGGTSGSTFNVAASSGGTNNKSNNKVVQTGTPAPTVTSSSHANQNDWNKNNNIELAWARTTGVTGYSFSFDQSEGTVPSTVSNSNETSIKYPNKSDGIWYFHIRANGPNGWSSTANYRVQIDTAAPTDLTIVTEPKDESGKRPMVSFNATDAASGIDYYEIKMDNEDFQKATSPYTPSSIKSGDHVFTVRVFDKAGNMLENKVSIHIKDVPIPKITNPQVNATFKLIQSLDISGTADSTTKIDLYLDGVNIAKDLEVKDDGTWSMTHKGFIKPGQHKITAVATRDGIESKTSDTVTIKIDPSAISIFGRLIPSVLIIIVLLAIIGLLVVALIWLILFIKRNKDKIKGKFSRNKKQTEDEVNKKFSEMEHKLQKDVQDIYEKKKQLTSKEKQNLEDKIKIDLKKSEKDIIDTLEKDSKDS